MYVMHTVLFEMFPFFLGPKWRAFLLGQPR